MDGRTDGDVANLDVIRLPPGDPQSETAKLARETFRDIKDPYETLLAACLQTGPMAETLEGSEPRELIREYYRLRRGGHALVSSADVPEDTTDAVGTILYEWGPEPPPEERSRYASSPHRIEMTARLIRDSDPADHANEALRLLPEWTQWCIEQSGLAGDLAARSRAAALTEAAALVDEKTNAPAAEQDEPPFRRQE